MCVQTFCLPVLPVEKNLVSQKVNNSTDNAVYTHTHTHKTRLSQSFGSKLD